MENKREIHRAGKLQGRRCRGGGRGSRGIDERVVDLAPPPPPRRAGAGGRGGSEGVGNGGHVDKLEGRGALGGR